MTLQSLVSRLGAAFAAVAFCTIASAQNFPTRPIKIIVPYAAGGSSDIVGRIAAQHMGALLGQPIVVENIGGSGGIAAIETLMRSPADGYTLLVADAGHWAINPALQRKLPYDAVKDLAPVGMITTSALYLIVHESVPANTLQELVTLVKANPSKYTYGSSGIGSVHHLSMEAFKAGLGLDILHVPYKGTAQSVPAVVGGQVSMTLSAGTSVAGFIKAGKVKMLAANTEKRSSLNPTIPSIGEAGIENFNYPGELALVAPAGTPRAVIDKLSGALAKAVQIPEAAARFKAIGVEPGASQTPEKLSETIRADISKYARAVKISGTKVD
jgi:tripartite-type tricarboxylate transporter receptor subunit TctC